MLWFKRAFIGLSFVAFLGACGFQPVYSTGSSGAASDSTTLEFFQNIQIGYLSDREGQYFRNRLTQLIHINRREPNPQFDLTMTLSESKVNLAVERTAQATRASLRVTVRYNLTDNSTGGGEMLVGDLTATSGYNIFRSEFQTLVAEQGARERALDSLAEQLRLRLATFAATQQRAAGAS